MPKTTDEAIYERMSLQEAVATARALATTSTQLMASERVAILILCDALWETVECICDGGPQGEGLVSLPHEPHCPLAEDERPDAR